MPQYTYADYKQWKGDSELIEGIPYSMSPSPIGKHQYVVGQLILKFSVASKKHNNYYIYSKLDWIISNTTVFRPDIFIFCGERIDDYLRESPQLIVEVLSPKTASKD